MSLEKIFEVQLKKLQVQNTLSMFKKIWNVDGFAISQINQAQYKQGRKENSYEVEVTLKDLDNTKWSNNPIYSPSDEQLMHDCGITVRLLEN